ncbi:LacI family DNA-binding transcriptional regulator [Halalkalibacter sp. APA_J-10(15)]|uniref:LacI family DNA-binding transcriptional regulator n=1 Tax=Halalkalibacter sp. APA_J-10(15) TaxID=2933805 RepID=UPI001FF6BD7B|nr:LacI family DNA-binding transcriptional regulator [Halalkalibacter sp. APA_J-10(15)]MCK0470099.1 LacI family DNA-binding transcriptional regulator [Halalkalibacter sp. APA_J-10(15)]
MKVTAKTIAEELNLSLATVDRVFHNRGGVSPKTVRKVLDKAKELNYTPNKSARFLSKKRNLRIAFVFPKYPEYFWREIEAGINSTLEDIQDYGFNIELFKVPYKLKDQLEVVEQIIRSKSYQGLVICPTDDAPLTDCLRAAVGKGFPVYTFNNDSPLSQRLSYVGADYYDAGRLAGELLHRFTNESKRMAVVIDEADTFQMKEKKRGFEEFIINLNHVTSVNILKIDNRQLEQSIHSFKNLFQEIDAVYVACGALAEVSEQIADLQLSQKLVLIGHDMSDAIYHYLQEDVITATICQNPQYQGSIAVKTAFNHLMMEKPIEKKENIVKLEIVTKGNSKYYIY